MTFWLDAHLHPELAVWLGSRYKIVVKTLREIGLRDAEDTVLFDAARRFGDIVVITKDSDFVELVERLGTPPQIIWLTTGNSTKLELQAIIERSFEQVLLQIAMGTSVVEISR
jgi:predicted nuclease of predicted toxin-antitoxin system